MSTIQKHITIIGISCILCVSLPFAAQGRSLNELSVYVWNLTTPDRQENDLTRNLTREFDEKLFLAGCFQKVLDRRELDRLLAHKENEKQLLGIEGISPESLSKLQTTGANSVIFGEVYDDVDSGEVKVTVVVQAFDGEKLALASIRFSRGKIYDAESRENYMQELARALCSQQEEMASSHPPMTTSSQPSVPSDNRVPPEEGYVSVNEVKVQGIDNPVPLELDTTYKIILDKNEQSYFKISLPTDKFKVILDARRDTMGDGLDILAYNLSLLDSDGVPIKNDVIRISELRVDLRTMYFFPLEAAATVGFKLSNEYRKTTFWLTILKESAPASIPFFGEMLPKPISEGKTESGILARNESAYYSIDLKKGNYKVFLDFTSSFPKRDNALIGYLAILDADGGKQKELIHLSKTDVSCREGAKFSVKEDTRLIIRIQNEYQQVNYMVKISFDSPQ